MGMSPLPKFLQDTTFNIVIKKGATLPGGCLLEKFCLYKGKEDVVKIYWSVGFGYQWGSHTPGAGGSDVISAEFFIEHDLYAFATYISKKYKDYVTFDDIYFNEEIQTLFELLTLAEKT